MRARPTHRHGLDRRGFSLVEMLIALAISAALLSATMAALNACFIAYQRTTEEASTHTIGRLAVHRMMALIRTGSDFGPFPVDPKDSIVTSDFVEFRASETRIITLEYSEADETLYIKVLDETTGTETTHALLEGVPPQFDGGGNRLKPFTLEYQFGRKLYRATIDLTVDADDNASMDLEGDYVNQIRLVASTMPRAQAF